MRTRQSGLGARRRGALAQWVSLALISSLLSLPAAGFAEPPGSTSQPRLGAPEQNAAPLIGTIFTVNSTGDGAAGCGSPAQECTLRAAILSANSHAGDDGISFAIPLTDP